MISRRVLEVARPTASADLGGHLQCRRRRTGQNEPKTSLLGRLQPELGQDQENVANKPRFPRFSRTSCTFEDTARVFAVFTVPKFNLAGACDASAVTTAKMAATRGDDPAAAAAQDLATGGAAARRASADYRVGVFNRLPFEDYRVDERDGPSSPQALRKTRVE